MNFTGCAITRKCGERTMRKIQWKEKIYLEEEFRFVPVFLESPKSFITASNSSSP